MYQGTFHHVQRYVGPTDAELSASDADGVALEPNKFWVDVPFEDGTAWRSRRFVTAANHIDDLHAQELASGAEPEQYRVVKRTFHEEVIVPRWRYVEFRSGVGNDGVEIWERIAFGEHGAAWRCRSFGAAKAEIRERLTSMSDAARFRIIGPNGEVEAGYARADFTYYPGDDDDDDDDASLTESLELQLGDVPDEG